MEKCGTIQNHFHYTMFVKHWFYNLSRDAHHYGVRYVDHRLGLFSFLYSMDESQSAINVQKIQTWVRLYSMDIEQHVNHGLTTILCQVIWYL